MARTVARRRTADTPSTDRYARSEEVQEDVHDEPEDHYDDDTSSSSSPGYDRDEIGSGWEAYEEAKTSGGGYADKVTLKDDGDSVLILPLEDAPFAFYWRHWVNAMGQYKSTTKKQNALTAVGNKPQARTAFNVLVFAENGEPLDEPVVKVLDASPTLAVKIKAVHEDEKRGPLTSNYLEITVNKTEGRGGKGGRTDYNVQTVKERDLEEDFDCQPLEAEVVEEIIETEMFTKDDYPFLNTDADIEEAADTIASRAGARGEDWKPPTRRGR